MMSPGEPRINKEYVLSVVAEARDSISFVKKVSQKPFDSLSDAEKYAIRYHLIIIAEALASIALHICRNMLSQRPETPSHAVRLIADNNIIPGEVAENILRFLRMRNLLVHRYWTVDDRKIYENIKSNFNSIENFLEVVLEIVRGEI